MLLASIAAGALSGCALLNTEQMWDARTDAQGNTIFLDTPRMWVEWQDGVNGAVTRELAGEPVRGGMATWDAHWRRVIRANQTSRENPNKYIDYLILTRQRAGLPPLQVAEESMGCAFDAADWYNIVSNNDLDFRGQRSPTLEQVRAIVASIPADEKARLVATTGHLFPDRTPEWTQQRYLMLMEQVGGAFGERSAKAFGLGDCGVAGIVGDYLYAIVQEGLVRPYEHHKTFMAETRRVDRVGGPSSIVLGGVVLELNGVAYDFNAMSRAFNATLEPVHMQETATAQFGRLLEDRFRNVVSCVESACTAITVHDAIAPSRECLVVALRERQALWMGNATDAEGRLYYVWHASLGPMCPRFDVSLKVEFEGDAVKSGSIGIVFD